MAHLFRLIVAGLLLLVSGGAWAACDPASPTSYSVRSTTCDYKSEAVAWVNTGVSIFDCGAWHPGYAGWQVANVTENMQASKYTKTFVCSDGSKIAGGFSYNATFNSDDPVECTAGKKETGSYRIVDEANRPGGTLCLDGCEYNVSDEATEEVYWSEGGVGVYRLDGEITATGEQCGPGTDQPGIPELDDEPPNICYDIGHGFQQCTQDPLRCVRAPDGTRLCPDQPGPDCRLTPKHAACSDRPPPPDYDDPRPPITIEYCRGGNCGNINMGSDSGDDDDDDDDGDDDCEPGDPDCDEEEDEDEPDCPANDPDCEDDDDDDAPRASDSGCETETPSCSDMGHVECQILIRTHRTNCTVAYGNKMLEEFRDRQIEEIRESNAKLKALKEQFVASTSEVKDVISNSTEILETAIDKSTHQQKETTEKLRDVQRDIRDQTTQVTASLSNVQDAVNQGATATGTAISGQTAELSGKLDEVRQAVEGITPGNVDVSVDNSEVVTAIQNQTSEIIGSSVDPGEGATQEDMDALVVRSVTDGPIGPAVVDMTGFLGNSCPAFDIGFTLGGVPWQLDNTLWCDFLSIIRACMYLLAAWWAVMILLGK